MTDKTLTDVAAARRKKLDELFADQPYLSPTMRASCLHDRLADEPPPIQIPVIGSTVDDEITVRFVDARREGMTSLTAVPLCREPIEPERPLPAPAAALSARLEPIRVPREGELRLELLLDINAATSKVEATVRPLEGEVMTLKEAARFLRVGEGTVRAWSRSGELPTAYLGARRRYRRSALIEWLKGHERRG